MLYLGVDLGGTNIKAALVNSEGEILCEAGIPTNLPRPAEAVCDDIATLCLQLAEGKDVAGVGVGCPGTVDGGTVLYSNNLDRPYSFLMSILIFLIPCGFWPAGLHR